ncbi:hypothetical protein FA95DRAFT_652625 [Auriscalpium vulgare]|uniref:Uncharacterized protein n=1 Tax=Auriscalpium vulgare TaxID=40419 RepID=A0ACB8RCD6_9AGAM|nr:hypothetical protein FA95DRAFT_652625 [Auriscalpium vulgare]
MMRFRRARVPADSRMSPAMVCVFPHFRHLSSADDDAQAMDTALVATALHAWPSLQQAMLRSTRWRFSSWRSKNLSNLRHKVFPVSLIRFDRVTRPMLINSQSPLVGDCGRLQ